MEELGLDPGLQVSVLELLPRHPFHSPVPFSLKFYSRGECEFMGEEDIRANSSRDEKGAWRKVIGPDWGGGAADRAWGS